MAQDIPWAANDIGTMWALVPTIVRLKDHGIGTWSAVTNAKIDSVTSGMDINLDLPKILP